MYLSYNMFILIICYTDTCVSLINYTLNCYVSTRCHNFRILELYKIYKIYVINLAINPASAPHVVHDTYIFVDKLEGVLFAISSLNEGCWSTLIYLK